jgi:predicted RNA-binding Zn ribbon-like protein
MAPAPTLYGSRQSRQVTGRTETGRLMGGALFLDVVNTVDLHHDVRAIDQLGSGYVTVLTWFAQAGFLDDDAARRLAIRAGKEPREAAAVRKRLIALRSALYDIVVTLVDGEPPPEPALHILNDEVAVARAGERLASDGPALAWRDEIPQALDVPVRLVARSAVEILTSSRVARIRQCESSGCQRLFLDTSKNGSRRYCSSTTCGSRVRVRRFRDRLRTVET